MSLFDFITDEEFRECLEKDYGQMIDCAKAKAWKAVHVISGSIIEAVLIDSLVSEDIVNRESALKLDLASAIGKSREKEIISERTSELTIVIKGYRNLIHPGREIRLGEKASEESAQVVQALVKMIVEEVCQRKRKSYGYTAEQIANKLLIDSSAEAIIEHLLIGAKEKEIERLLLIVLPDRYMNVYYEEDPPGHILPALCKCFSIAYQRSSEATKRKVAKRFVSILKEESGQIIFSYGTAFIKAKYLSYLSNEEVLLIKEHLLSRLQKNAEDRIIDALEGIGPYIQKGDVSRFLDPILSLINSCEDYATKESAEQRICSEFLLTDKAVGEAIMDRLDIWINFYSGKGMKEKSNAISEIKMALECPF